MSKAGRPIERKGEYERIALDVRKDLLKMVDASPKSRREYIEDLLVVEKGTAMQYSEILEQYIKSADFKEGVIAATKASWGGSGYSVELFEDGTWRNLWNNEIGNRYNTPGIILALPVLSDENPSDEEKMDEEEYFEVFFGAEEDELAQGMRTLLSDNEL
jgi:hypothetical protein